MLPNAFISSFPSGWSSLRIPESISWNDVDGELVLFNRDDGRYHSLNSSGSQIWRNLAHGMDYSAVLSELAKHYAMDDPAGIEASVRSFIMGALDAGVLGLSEESPA